VGEKGEAKVIGEHRKIENISEPLKKRFLDNGISAKELSQFLNIQGEG
jgi:pilus assembly protein CpaF